MNIQGNTALPRSPFTPPVKSLQLSEKDLRIALTLICLPTSLLILGMAIQDTTKTKPQFPEQHPPIDSRYHKTASKSGYNSQFVTLFRLACLAIVSRGALGSAICDTSSITQFGTDLTNLVAATTTPLSAQKSTYITDIQTQNQTLYSQLSDIEHQLSSCMDTPSDANQFATLQVCSTDISTVIQGFSSPLLSLNTTLSQKFNTDYSSESELSHALVPYTGGQYTPLRAGYEEARLAYTTPRPNGCGIIYAPYIRNLTNEAIVARDSFLGTLQTGYDQVTDVFRNNPMSLSEQVKTDFAVCTTETTASEILTCLANAKLSFNTDTANLYQIPKNLLIYVNQFQETTAAINLSPTDFKDYYTSLCQQTASLRSAAIGCGWVPPTNPPTSQPTGQPTGIPTDETTEKPTQEKTECKDKTWEDFLAHIMGTASITGLVFGVGGYYLGEHRTEKRIKNDAIQAAATANSLEATTLEDGTVADETVTNTTLATRVSTWCNLARFYVQTGTRDPDRTPPEDNSLNRVLATLRPYISGQLPDTTAVTVGNNEAEV